MILILMILIMMMIILMMITLIIMLILIMMILMLVMTRNTHNNDVIITNTITNRNAYHIISYDRRCT